MCVPACVPVCVPVLVPEYPAVRCSEVTPIFREPSRSLSTVGSNLFAMFDCDRLLACLRTCCVFGWQGRRRVGCINSPHVVRQWWYQCVRCLSAQTRFQSVLLPCCGKSPNRCQHAELQSENYQCALGWRVRTGSAAFATRELCGPAVPSGTELCPVVPVVSLVVEDPTPRAFLTLLMVLDMLYEFDM